MATQYYGFVGSTLFVNLTTGELRKEPLDLEVAEKFVGGSGISYKLLYDLLKLGTDPLSPENPIIIGVGPLCGTAAIAASKVTATMKFPAPATRSKKEEKYVIGTGVGGSRRFGAMIKNAGYDHVVITGRARKPSYLKIIDDDVEICDASDLWGKSDIFETSDELTYRHRGRTGRAGVWAIGRAGEKLSIGAIGLVDKRNSLGRWGGGAVLGSKNLKAIVTLGTGGVKVANEKHFLSLVDSKRQELMSHPYFRVTVPGIHGVPSSEYPLDLEVRTTANTLSCMGCLDACRKEFKIEGGRFDGQSMRAGSSAISRDFGRRLRLSDYREMYKLCDLINAEGLDLPGTLRMLFFVTRLYERGVISEKDTGGLVLSIGNFDSYAQLLEKYINREYIGDVMAKGWYALSERVGVDAREDRDGATILKGFDSLTDPRFESFSSAKGIALLVRPRAQHLHQGSYYPAGENIYRDTYWPEFNRSLNDLKRDMLLTGANWEDVARVFTEKDANWGRLEKHHEDAHALLDALGVCDSAQHRDWDPNRNVPFLAKLYSAATGFEVGTSEFKKRGERAWTMETLLNVREGWTRKDEEIPPCWLRNMEIPLHIRGGEHYFSDWLGRRVSKEQIIKWLDDYYDERGWDIRIGIPTVEKLRELELKEFVGIIEPFLQK